MVRYVLGGLLGIAVLVVLFGERGDLVAARHELGHLAARAAGDPRRAGPARHVLAACRSGPPSSSPAGR
jgi:hypothetical protein